MTKYRKSNQSTMPSASEIIKTIIFLAAVVWLTNQVFGNKATAATVVQNAPNTTQFIVDTATYRKVVVTTWVKDGVHCTLVDNPPGTALSCVKAP
jgi:hypothetical protein